MKPTAAVMENRAIYDAYVSHVAVRSTPAKKIWLALGIVLFAAIDLGVMYATFHGANVDSMGNPLYPLWVTLAMATISLCVFMAIKLFLDKTQWGRLRYYLSLLLGVLLFGVVLYCLFQEKGAQVSESISASSGSGLDHAFDGTSASAGASMGWMMWVVLSVEAVIRLIPGVICILLARAWSRLSRAETESKLAQGILTKFAAVDRLLALLQAQTELKSQLPTLAKPIEDASVSGALNQLRTRMAADLQAVKRQLDGQALLDGQTKQALENKRQQLEGQLALAQQLH